MSSGSRRSSTGVVVPVAEQAAAVAEDVTRRLADPARVRAAVVENGGERLWTPNSLIEGYAGIAILLADEPKSAHSHLAAAVTQRTSAGRGLFTGDLALGFAASVLARSEADYRGLRDAADKAAERSIPERVEYARERRYFSGYDVLSGLTGLGRYLLAAGRDEALRAVLSALVELLAPIEVHGRKVPGWWVASPPSAVASAERYVRGHVNLGLAHGVSGPLALLASTARAGVIVPGQRLLIEDIATWLIGHRGGGGWPGFLSFEEETSGELDGTPLTRAGWCYSTPGVARALQLAGLAVDEPAWGELAVASMRALLSGDRAGWGIVDASLCHGAAGLLHITTTIAEDSGDPGLLAALPGLAGLVLEYFEEDIPFGFRFHDKEVDAVEDRAGLLEGAAGVALALKRFAGASPSTWDTALLLN